MIPRTRPQNKKARKGKKRQEKKRKNIRFCLLVVYGLVLLSASCRLDGAASPLNQRPADFFDF
jgi:hypothetical protein